jgi:fused signal recognition particle receptor
MENGFLSRIKSALRKTSEMISIAGGKINEDLLREIEETLILADVGAETSAQLASKISRWKLPAGDRRIKQQLADEIFELLRSSESDFFHRNLSSLHIMLIVGVNGNGKTTTAAKMANIFKKTGHKPLLVAADTFRAAAVEQLTLWADKIGVAIAVGRAGSDPAGLVYTSIERATLDGNWPVIVDTAGRMQNRDDLMAELEKIKRVAGKFDADTRTILVLDGLTGQAAHNQVGAFLQKVGVDGLVVTKLDGTAKGGAIIALTQKYKLPILAIGVGEGPDDLRPFSAREYADALAGV